MQAMKSLMLKAVLAGVMLVAVAPLGAQAATPTQNVLHQACTHGVTFAGCSTSDQGIDTTGAGHTTFLQDLVNTFLFAAGLVAVIFLIIGGIRYITSTGDSQRIKAAKDTILYAIIGLVVVIVARAIVGFVAGSLS
jgi:hypothetical protein